MLLGLRYVLQLHWVRSTDKGMLHLLSVGLRILSLVWIVRRGPTYTECACLWMQDFARLCATF